MQWLSVGFMFMGGLAIGMAFVMHEVDKMNGASSNHACVVAFGGAFFVLSAIGIGLL